MSFGTSPSLPPFLTCYISPSVSPSSLPPGKPLSQSGIAGRHAAVGRGAAFAIGEFMSQPKLMKDLGLTTGVAGKSVVVQVWPNGGRTEPERGAGSVVCLVIIARRGNETWELNECLAPTQLRVSAPWVTTPPWLSAAPAPRSHIYSTPHPPPRVLLRTDGRVALPWWVRLSPCVSATAW